MIVSVIMAGGRSERFWPASRMDRPKQFVSLTGGPTLFQEAVRRVIQLTPVDSIFPVIGRDHLGFLHEQAFDIPEDNYIIEPVGRDTAACLALAAFSLRGRYPNLDPVMLVLAADHVIAEEERFRDILASWKKPIGSRSFRSRSAGMTWEVGPRSPRICPRRMEMP